MLNSSDYKLVHTAPPGAGLLLLLKAFCMTFISAFRLIGQVCAHNCDDTRSCFIWKLKMPSEHTRAHVDYHRVCITGYSINSSKLNAIHTVTTDSLGLQVAYVCSHMNLS